MEQRLEAIEKRLQLLETPLSNETLLLCVQCGENYLESRNPEGVCEFHTQARGDSWSRKPGLYLCCETSKRGCERRRHRSEHHEDYTYSAYTDYFLATLKQVHEVWVDIERYDLSTDDDLAISAQIGMLKNQSLYVLAGKRIKVVSKLFWDSLTGSIEVLKDNLSPRSYAVINLEKNKTLTAAVRSGSDEGTESAQVNILWQDGRPILSDRPVTTKLNPASPLPSSIRIPENKQEGAELSVNDPPEPMIYQAEVSLGCPLTLALNQPLEVSTSWTARNGTFTQYVKGEIILMNPSNTPLLISEIWTEYLDKNGKWIKSSEKSEHVGVRLDAAQAVHLAVSCAIKVTGEPGGDNQSRARLHASQPDPVTVCFHVDMADGAKLSIKGDHVNAKLDIPTKQAIEMSIAGTVQHWSSCDDCERAVRHFVYIYQDEKGGWVIKNSINSSTYFTFLPLALAKVGFRAKIAGESERWLDTLASKTDDGHTTFDSFALVQNAVVYGFKFIIKTATGRSESYFRLPPSDDTVTLTLDDSGPFKPNQLLSIRWKSTSIRSSSNLIAIYREYAPSRSDGYLGDYINLAPGKEGSARLRLPLEPGTYEIRLVGDGILLGRSMPISVPT